jgi:hypothetical protein
MRHLGPRVPQKCRNADCFDSDVLRRHYQSCKSAQNADESMLEASRHVNRACSSCRHFKLKCSGGQPCDRCCNLGQSELCGVTYRKSRMLDVSDASKPPTTVIYQPERNVLSPEQSQHNHLQQNIPPHQDLGTTHAVVNGEVQGLGPQATRVPSNTWITPRPAGATS